jgi:hypothetical protein
MNLKVINRFRPAAIRAAMAVALLSLSACIVVPVVDRRAEVPCDLATRQITLDVQQIAALGGCRGDECLAQLVVGGFVFATSLVVSGSVAIVGNTMHWIERVRKCGRDKSQDWPQNVAPVGPAMEPKPSHGTVPAAVPAPQPRVSGG